MHEKKPSVLKAERLVFGAVIAMLSYPLLGSLWHHDYPFLTVEAVCLGLIAAFTAAFIAFVSKQVSPSLTNLILLIIGLLCATLQLDLRAEGILVFLGVGLAVGWLLGPRMPQALMIVFSAAIVGAYLDHQVDQRANKVVDTGRPLNAELAPVIHLVLDGFIGIDGLPPQQPAQEFRNELLVFLEKWRFEVSTKAYSRYSGTERSMRQALSLDPSKIVAASVMLRTTQQVPGNRYLDHFSDLGYRLRVYQSDNMDFCGGVSEPLERCFTYTLPDVSSALASTPGLNEKLSGLVKVTLRRSVLLSSLAEFYGIYLDQNMSVFDLDTFNVLSEDILDNDRGRLFFAHLLAPHAPYTLGPNCQLVLGREWGLQVPRNEGQGNFNSYETRGMRYMTYFDQARCVLNRLDLLFSSMDNAGVFEQSTIILHGDHGSRISINEVSAENIDKLTQSDLRDTYSTLFAARFADSEFALNPMPTPLAEALGQIYNRVVGSDVIDITAIAGEAELYFTDFQSRKTLVSDPFIDEVELEQAKAQFRVMYPEDQRVGEQSD